MDDRDLVARQVGRAPRAFRRVVVRCPWGMPAVTEQEPYAGDGAPFPTTYYLTCHHLVAAVSRIEAAGGVEHGSAPVATDPALRASVEQANALQRSIRHELAGERRGEDGGRSLELGVGGTRKPERLKCLHAHVAFALAHPGYALGEGVLAEVPERWPADRCCAGH